MDPQSRPARIVTLTLNPALDVSTATPEVRPSDKLRCEARRLAPGGGGVNVARVVQRMGGEALAVATSGGRTGERVMGMLAAEKLAVAMVPVRGETRECFNVTDRKDGAEYRFVLPGADLSEAEWSRCLETAVAATRPEGLLVVSGSLPPGPPPGVIGDLARRCREAGLRLVVDSSGAALAGALAAGIHLAKANLRELADCLGRPLPDQAARLRACREIIAGGGAEIVALTLGAEGALLVTADQALVAAPLTIRAVSTVGAGDSFLAALLWAMTGGLEPPEALRHASAAGAAALLSPGADLCHREEVFRLAGVIAVSPAGGA